MDLGMDLKKRIDAMKIIEDILTSTQEIMFVSMVKELEEIVNLQRKALDEICNITKRVKYYSIEYGYGEISDIAREVLIKTDKLMGSSSYD